MMWYPARCSSRSRAFTLIELLVVIGIIVVLLAILLPTIARARDRAHTVKCASNMRQIYMASVMYADMLGKLPIPGESGFPNGFEPGSCAAYGGTGLHFERGGLWAFLGSSPADRAAIFQCPSDEDYYISPTTIGHSTHVIAYTGGRRNYSYCFNCEMRGPLDPESIEAVSHDPPGIRITDISRPERKILFIEIQQIDRLDFDYVANEGPRLKDPKIIGDVQDRTFTHRHFGKGNQCFADGHVELMLPIAPFLPWEAGSDAYEYLDLFHNPDR